MTFEESLIHERDAMIVLSELYHWRTIKTPRYARMDGIILNYDNDMNAVYEFKARSMTFDDLRRHETYLITYEKILDGCHAARTLGVPFVLIVYLIGSENIILFKVADENGDLLIDFDVVRTTTQKNVTGGAVERYNAFIGLNHAKVLR